jgi:hypothetical protein
MVETRKNARRGLSDVGRLHRSGQEYSLRRPHVCGQLMRLPLGMFRAIECRKFADVGVGQLVHRGLFVLSARDGPIRWVRFSALRWDCLWPHWRLPPGIKSDFVSRSTFGFGSSGVRVEPRFRSAWTRSVAGTGKLPESQNDTFVGYGR